MPASAATARCCACNEARALSSFAAPRGGAAGLGAARRPADASNRRPMLTRVLEPETLDHLAADDPAAQRARRDLRRVNAFMGARRILARALARALPGERSGLRILEIGCGDGRLLLDVARRRGARWPAAQRRPARPPADRRRRDARRLCRRGLAGADDRRRRPRLGVRGDGQRALGRSRRQPVPAPFRRRSAGPRARRLRAPRRRARCLRAAAQPLRARREPLDLLPRRKRGDAPRRRAERSRRLRRQRAGEGVAGRRGTRGASTNTRTARSRIAFAPCAGAPSHEDARSTPRSSAPGRPARASRSCSRAPAGRSR